MTERRNSKHKYPKVERKHDEILGVKVSITSVDQVLDFVRSKLNLKEKFYIVTPNPENLLMATKDWLLRKSIRRSDLSVPDGIGLAMAHRFLKMEDYKDKLLRPLLIFNQGLKVGAAAFWNKKYLTDSLNIVKGRELFLELIKLSDEMKLKVYLFGGEKGESEATKIELEKKFTNITFKTNHQFPEYNKNCKPINLVNRRLHKAVIGSIKMFEPDLVFVALNTPKQEKWIYRNFFRLTKVTGAMAIGGTFNYIADNMHLPPKWMEKIGLEWLYRFIQEPKRVVRIVNAVIVFPWTVFMTKLLKK